MFKKHKWQDGFVHLSLIIAIAAVIVVVGIVGSRVISKSDAAAYYSNHWADCYSNPSFKIGQLASDRWGSSKWTLGPAVKFVTIEYSDAPTGKLLYKLGQQTYKQLTWKKLYRFPVLDPTKGVSRERKATYTAYCPNAKSSGGSHYKTDVRRAIQPAI